MPIIQILVQFIQIDEIVVTPAIALGEWRPVFFANGFACCVQTDEL